MKSPKKLPGPFVSHPWHGIRQGRGLPREFTAVVEIPAGSNVKYELDKETGLLRLDRVLSSAVFFPANYGFIPGTLAEDEDPLDVLVVCQEALSPLTIVMARAVGVMTMIDGGKKDHKIVAVATADPEFASCRKASELPAGRLAALKRFFSDYKALEKKDVEVNAILAADEAFSIIDSAIRRYTAEFRRDRGSRSEQEGTD